ncbi:hypothetical protein DICPUDRAFT_156599 [Dictyostelium purpureum]|uniref:Uncharacterized protein n=1 Tax=Dictyostelium purpureum TaxID=5786 RepID=F0ZWZ8_DICPU|nr:uncharacterized protein DICPUDRAFT_156599 [Dictyostelium purpureum]EGC31543.1 hypothetical protein DICPUDRAFT_156599 [Dictyostelium purpureum]|eukprot:XP_003291943.1 hypothetical protein DICPUDRAFT_156599 [Dictyostelium purpureum]
MGAQELPALQSLTKTHMAILTFCSLVVILKLIYIYRYEKKKNTAAKLKKIIHYLILTYIFLILILNYIQIGRFYYNPAIWTIFYKVVYNICGFLFTSSFILLLTYWIGMITDIFEIRKGAIFTKYTGPVFMVVQFSNFVIKLLTIISNAKVFYLQTRLALEKASIYFDFFVNTGVLFILITFIVLNLYVFNKKVRRRIKIFTVIAAVVGATFFCLTLLRVLIYYDSSKYSYGTLTLVSALTLEVVFVVYPIRIDVINNRHVNKFFGLFYIGFSKETRQDTLSSHKKTNATIHQQTMKDKDGGLNTIHDYESNKEPTTTVSLEEFEINNSPNLDNKHHSELQNGANNNNENTEINISELNNTNNNNFNNNTLDETNTNNTNTTSSNSSSDSLKEIISEVQ